jgi:hypothetical protein
MRIVNKRRFGIAIGVLVMVAMLVGFGLTELFRGKVTAPDESDLFELSEEDHMLMGSIHRHLNGLVCRNREHQNHGSREAVEVLGYVKSLASDIQTDILAKDLSLLVAMLEDYANGVVPQKRVKEHAAWMHRIAHDLDYQGRDGTDYYGATFALEGKSAKSHKFYGGR